ncbi:hypothetical protein K8S17_02670 [bacterium]|nr:hypothetical protein [bacterium]
MHQTRSIRTLACLGLCVALSMTASTASAGALTFRGWHFDGTGRFVHNAGAMVTPTQERLWSAAQERPTHAEPAAGYEDQDTTLAGCDSWTAPGDEDNAWPEMMSARYDERETAGIGHDVQWNEPTCGDREDDRYYSYGDGDMR